MYVYFASLCRDSTVFYPYAVQQQQPTPEIKWKLCTSLNHERSWRLKKSQLRACVDSRMLSTTVANPVSDSLRATSGRPRVKCILLPNPSISCTAYVYTLVLFIMIRCSEQCTLLNESHRKKEIARARLGVCVKLCKYVYADPGRERERERERAMQRYCTSHCLITDAHWGRAYFQIVLLLTSKLYHFQILLVSSGTIWKWYNLAVVQFGSGTIWKWEVARFGSAHGPNGHPYLIPSRTMNVKTYTEILRSALRSTVRSMVSSLFPVLLSTVEFDVRVKVVARGPTVGSDSTSNRTRTSCW